MTLRPLELKDSEAIFQLRSNPEVMKYMDTETCLNSQDAEIFINRQIESNNNEQGANWGIYLDNSDKAIGYAGFWRINKAHFRGEIGYALDPEYWRNGLMKEVLECVARFGFQNLGLHSIEANINPDNKASAKLLLKLGFKLEAKFKENFYFNGSFLDSEIYSLLKSNFKSESLNCN